MHLKTPFIFDLAPEVEEERIALLMLPGAKNTPQQLVENGFIAALRQRKLPIDVLALDTPVDLYLERADIECVLHHALDEVRARGYRRIWLLGISLGGSGAMICATQRMTEIEVVFLLAPFLGTRGIIAEIEKAGGFAHWQAGEIAPRDQERALLKQIQGGLRETHNLPNIYLGYGSEDRYRGASMLLAEQISEQQVIRAPGGHDWKTWTALWHTMLDKHALRR